MQDISEYFGTCDPNDRSRGALSDYVGYLKSDEKGNDAMFDEFTKEFEEVMVKKAKAEIIANVITGFGVSFDVAMKT